MNNRSLNRHSVHRPAPRRTIGALLASAALTLTACGDGPSDGGPADAAGFDPVAAWQVYYDLTHPDPETSTGSDPAAAWQVYYDLTHPDPGTSTGS
jgi:hypothetical protein